MAPWVVFPGWVIEEAPLLYDQGHSKLKDISWVVINRGGAVGPTSVDLADSKASRNGSAAKSAG